MLKQIVNGVRTMVSNISLQADHTVTATKFTAKRTTYTAAVKAPKRTRAEIAQAQDDLDMRDLLAAGGIVARGAWTAGSGNYKRTRNVPTGACTYASYDTSAPAHVRAWFAQHPRAQNAVAIIKAI